MNGNRGVASIGGSPPGSFCVSVQAFDRHAEQFLIPNMSDKNPKLQYEGVLVPYKSRKYTEPKNPVGTVAELFAGVGGFRIGLSRAGWKTTFSNQWEPSTKAQHASDVYVARFGSEGHSNEDIAKVASIPKTDLLVGGFPCQDYSVAKTLNSSKGLEGKKGVLWWEILRFVKKNKPRFIFLENVDRLLKSPSSQRGRDFAIMLKTLTDEGYIVEWRVVNSAEYGFPQRRIRVFIIAKLTNEVAGWATLDPEEYIANAGVLARALPAKPKDSMRTVSLKQTAVEISENFNLGGGKSPFASAGFARKGIAYSLNVAAHYKGIRSTLADIISNEDEVDSSFWVDENALVQWRYLKGSKKIKRIHKESGEEYNYAEGSMAFPDLLTNPSRTILTGEGGTTPSRFKHIIQVGKRHRRLTPLELERLNGFPDDWTATFEGGKRVNDARRAFFMGNALVVGLIERVGKVLASDL